MCMVLPKAKSKDPKECSKSSQKAKAVAVDKIKNSKPKIASVPSLSTQTKNVEKRPKGKKQNARNNRKKAKKTKADDDDADFQNRESLLTSDKLTDAEKATCE